MAPGHRRPYADLSKVNLSASVNIALCPCIPKLLEHSNVHSAIWTCITSVELLCMRISIAIGVGLVHADILAKALLPYAMRLKESSRALLR